MCGHGSCQSAVYRWDNARTLVRSDRWRPSSELDAVECGHGDVEYSMLYGLLRTFMLMW